MLERQRHEQILKDILRDIYTTPGLQTALALKGGTCLYMFYGLDRFSVDLDFNLRGESLDEARLTKVLAEHVRIEQRTDTYHTWFWLGSYEKQLAKIKVEVSKREFPDTYELKDFYGLSVPVLAPGHMFAHKLCAITDRSRLQARDIYDAHFMFRQHFAIDETIIHLRTGKSLEAYFAELAVFIDKHLTGRNVLHGLGELLDERQKDRVRAQLKQDILFDLKSRIGGD